MLRGNATECTSLIHQIFALLQSQKTVRSPWFSALAVALVGGQRQVPDWAPKEVTAKIHNNSWKTGGSQYNSLFLPLFLQVSDASKLNCYLNIEPLRVFLLCLVIVISRGPNLPEHISEDKLQDQKKGMLQSLYIADQGIIFSVGKWSQYSDSNTRAINKRQNSIINKIYTLNHSSYLRKGKF